MNSPLDPWSDAASLAQRLSQPQAALYIVLGAEQWCEKCRILRPHFEAHVAQTPSQETWLWLDLEEHAEFLGSYLPESLPQLVAYRGSQLHLNQVIEPTGAALAQALAQLEALEPPDRAGRVAPTGAQAKAQADPGLRARLLQQDWAS
jgi:hypothetical protein